MENQGNAVTIKMIGTGRFEIVLLEMPDSRYKIAYEFEGRTVISESIRDYSMASELFQIKFNELTNAFN